MSDMNYIADNDSRREVVSEAFTVQQGLEDGHRAEISLAVDPNEARFSSPSTDDNNGIANDDETGVVIERAMTATTTTPSTNALATAPLRPSFGIKKLRSVSPLTVQRPRKGFGRGSSSTAAVAASSSTASTGLSDFTLDLMPRDKIQKRTLFPWSVHHSVTTTKWIATFARPSGTGSVESSHSSGSNSSYRYVQFVFATQREAIKFCKAYAPPKMSSAGECFSCKRQGSFRHCRNCGVVCCDADSARWGTRMIPKTYITSPGSAVVRVCKACDWLSNAFCMALLQGRHKDSVTLYETGNVNLRTCFADIHREAMFPVHCAVMGGSLECLKWLVDSQACPISARVDSKTNNPLSVQTSDSRTLLDLAMTGRPKVDILSYLVNKGLSITDMKTPALAFKTLEAILKSTPAPAASPSESFIESGELVIDGNINDNDGSVATMTAIDDACNICFERNVDCVLTPCGHQVCCTDCGERMSKCPVCKTECSYLRVYRQ